LRLLWILNLSSNNIACNNKNLTSVKSIITSIITLNESTIANKCIIIELIRNFIYKDLSTVNGYCFIKNLSTRLYIISNIYLLRLTLQKINFFNIFIENHVITSIIFQLILNGN
jgi:hypothetical protein